MLKKVKHSVPFLIIFAVGLLLLSPLFQYGFYPMHDDTQVQRVHQMAKALSDGMFPVRWVYDLGYGYGYPIFNFYAPFAYYVGALFVFLGLSPLLGTKIMIGIPLFIAGCGMYFLAKEFWGKNGGIVSGIMTMTAPYVAVNVFVRGAIAEYYAFSFIPFVFYFLYKAYATHRFRFIILGSISFALVVISHNLTAMILLLFLGVFCSVLLILSVRKSVYKGFVIVVGTLSIGVLLSGFYFLPALVEMGYTNVSSQVGGGADYQDHYVCLIQLWESQWGYGGSVPGCVDGMSYRIGKVHLLLFFVSIPLLFLLKKPRERIALGVGLLCFVLAVFLLLPYSQFIWDVFSPFSYIQYPWRFLSITVLASSFLGGASVIFIETVFKSYVFRKIFQILFIVLVLAMCGVLYLKLFQPQSILNVTSQDYTATENLRFNTSKISDEYLPMHFKKPITVAEIRNEKVTVIDGRGTVQVQEDKTQELLFTVKAEEPLALQIHTAYFPAWKATVNSQELPLKEEDRGMSLYVPSGEYEVVLNFVQTPIQQVGNFLSFVGILLLIAGIIHRSRLKLSL